jgi:hypothetical protein
MIRGWAQCKMTSDRLKSAFVFTSNSVFREMTQKCSRRVGIRYKLLINLEARESNS